MFNARFSDFKFHTMSCFIVLLDLKNTFSILEKAFLSYCYTVLLKINHIFFCFSLGFKKSFFFTCVKGISDFALEEKWKIIEWMLFFRLFNLKEVKLFFRSSTSSIHFLFNVLTWFCSFQIYFLNKLTFILIQEFVAFLNYFKWQILISS